MKRPLSTIADCTPGAIVRLDAGLYRLLDRVVDGERWGLLLNADMTETGKHVYLAPRTRVLEVIAAPGQRADSGGEVDPFLLRVS